MELQGRSPLALAGEWGPERLSSHTPMWTDNTYLSPIFKTQGLLAKVTNDLQMNSTV